MVNVVYDARRYNFLICYPGAISYFRLHIINDVKQKWPGWVVGSKQLYLTGYTSSNFREKKSLLFIKTNEANTVEIKTNEDNNHPKHVWGQQKVTFLNIFFYEMKNWSVNFIVYYYYYFFFSLAGVQEIITLIKWITTHDKRWWEKFL